MSKIRAERQREQARLAEIALAIPENEPAKYLLVVRTPNGWVSWGFFDDYREEHKRLNGMGIECRVFTEY